MLKLKIVVVFFIFFQLVNYNVFAKFDNEIAISKINVELFNSDDERIKFIKDLIERGKTEEALEKLYEFIEVVEKNNETK